MRWTPASGNRKPLPSPAVEDRQSCLSKDGRRGFPDRQDCLSSTKKDHEDDQENQTDVDERSDVDFGLKGGCRCRAHRAPPDALEAGKRQQNTAPSLAVEYRQSCLSKDGRRGFPTGRI